MIYVHRDFTKIPKAKLDALKAVSDQLNEIADPMARKAFIAANSAVWSTVRDELSAMSFYKCWYTEAKEGVSRYQTDHFRPHGRAKQALKTFADGYSWLAFEIDNFRIVGVLANTQNQEHSETTVGKGDWFPLYDPSTRATLHNRSLNKEFPLLLDPVSEHDPAKIMFNDGGEAHPAADLPEEDKDWVDEAIVFLGIRQDQLNRLRKAIWRECLRKIDKYNRFFKKPIAQLTADERQTRDELATELRAMTSCHAPFASTARSCLRDNRLQALIAQDEFAPLIAAYHA